MVFVKSHAVLAFRVDDDAFHVAFPEGVIDGKWIGRTVRLVRASCRYGGSRPYFICPGVTNSVACERRVLNLFWLGPEFVCARCGRLSYRSQRESQAHRLLHRAYKIKNRLGHDTRMFSPIGRKPKGMWRRNYLRLLYEARGLERLADAAALAHLSAARPEMVSREVRDYCQSLLEKPARRGSKSNQ